MGHRALSLCWLIWSDTLAIARELCNRVNRGTMGKTPASYARGCPITSSVRLTQNR
jgi:hypothetical protein